MATKHAEPDIPEDEEIDLQDDDEEMMELEGVDMMEALGSMLTTDDGEIGRAHV